MCIGRRGPQETGTAKTLHPRQGCPQGFMQRVPPGLVWRVLDPRAVAGVSELLQKELGHEHPLFPHPAPLNPGPLKH